MTNKKYLNNIILLLFIMILASCQIKDDLMQTITSRNTDESIDNQASNEDTSCSGKERGFTVEKANSGEENTCN